MRKATRLAFMPLVVWIGALFSSPLAKRVPIDYFISVYILKNFTLRFFFLPFLLFFFFVHELGSGFLCVKMQNVRRVHRN